MSKPYTPSPSADDAELAAWQSAHADLLDRYRALPQSEPPARLDAAILAGARHATRHRRRPAWWIPLASAASLVAAAGIGWRVYLAESTRPGSATDASAPARQVLEVDLYPPSERQRALETAVNPPAAEEAPAAPAGLAAPAAPAKAAVSDPSVSATVDANAVDAIELRAEAASSESARRPASLAEPFTQSDHASLGRVPEQRAAPGTADRRDVPATAASPIPAEPKRQTQGKVEAEAAGRFNAAAPPESTAAATAIAEIQTLLARGEIVAARRAIRLFRSRYPDHPLPAEWRRYER